MRAADCLGDETIAAVLEGALPPEPAARARAHLGTCDACRRLVSAAIDAEAVSRRAPPLSLTSPGIVGPGAILVGRFRLEALLGQGGMGQVYLAQQLDLDRRVALKVLRPDLAADAVALGRFEREAKLAASLTHDRSVRVHELGRLPSGEPFLVMELLQGEDLGAVIKRGPVPLPLAVRWVVEACEVLAEAHERGIVHRDLKPQNLYLARSESGPRLKVLDFGLAKLVQRKNALTAMTADGVIVGSPRYMAPEQVLGASDIDARADVWSLGATLYHLLAGRPPFDGGTLEEILGCVLTAGVLPLQQLRPDVDGRLAGVVHRCLSADPAARPRDARALAALLAGPGEAVGATLAGTLDGGSAAPAEVRSLVGVTLAGRYEIVQRLGDGGQGTVYRAVQHPLGRDVAVKVLHASTGGERFAREAAIVQRLEHPNTVRMFDFGLTEPGPAGEPFMIFELVRGRTLAAEIQRGPMDERRIVRIVSQVLKALMEAHAIGVVHRDVKPENVLLVDHAGEPDFVKLVDFGVAREGPGDGGTRTGRIVGTPRYMAPEQLVAAGVDARADLYALGLVMAEMITARPVYRETSSVAVCMAQASPMPVPLEPEVVRSALGAVVARATQKPREQRFADARAMLAAIEGSATSSSGTESAARLAMAASASKMTAPAPAKRGPPWTALAIVASALGLGIALLFGLATSAYVFVRMMKDLPATGGPPTITVEQPASSGVLAALDEARLRQRLTREGFTVGATVKQNFGFCKYMVFAVGKGGAGGYTVAFWYDCDGGFAASECRRMNEHSPKAWTVAEGNRVLSVGLETLAESRALYEAIVVERPDAGR